MHLLFIVEATEHERGWGTRPDGFHLFKSEADADKWLKAIYDERVGRAPDEYNSYDKRGYQEVTAEAAQAVDASDIKMKWYRYAREFKAPKA